MRRKRLRFISLFLAVMLLLSTAIPITEAFAASHPENWFGYLYLEDECRKMINDAAGAPIISDEDLNKLTGEIRPGDKLSFQVEVDMSVSEENIASLLHDFSFNVTLPFGVNTIVSVYNSNAPLLTDEEYDAKLAEFSASIDEMEELLSDEGVIEEILASNDVESESLYRTYKDLVDNRNLYLDLYKKQLDIAKTQYGLIDDSYGTDEMWSGAFEHTNVPNTSVEGTYEECRDAWREEAWVEPIATQEEVEEFIAYIDENWASIVEQYTTMCVEGIEAYENGECDETQYITCVTGLKSIEDGTFYDTIVDYLHKCHTGYFKYDSEVIYRVLVMALTGVDAFLAYSGRYAFYFPDSVVKANKESKYIFQFDIVATDALSVGEYISIPTLCWDWHDNCSDSDSKCHTTTSSWVILDLPTTTYPVNSGMSLNADYNESDIYAHDERYMAMMYIENELGNSEYKQRIISDWYDNYMEGNYLKSIQNFTIEYRDEFDNIIKSETKEITDAYYNITPPDDIYDYKLVSPDNAKGVVANKSETITFYYEHKDAEIKVSYVDTNGNELAPSQTIKGKTLDKYTAEPAVIYGYEPIVIPENASGVLHEDSADVQYIYDLKNSSVTVNYLDENGEKLAESETITGKVFDGYRTEAKDFHGYALISTPNNATGTISEEVTAVDYIYKKIFGALPEIPYQVAYGNKLSDIKLPEGWILEDAAPDDTVGNVGSNAFNVIVPADDTHEEIRGTIIIEVYPSSWIEGENFEKLPTEPFVATYGDLLSSIELPEGWIFVDSDTNTTFDNVGINTFEVIVPGDDNHSEVRETIKVNVSPAKWVEGIDYDKLPTDPYKAAYGDLLSSIELPKGWIFVNSDANRTVSEVGINTFEVIVPGNDTHSEIMDTITISVTGKVVSEDPIVTEPDDNKPVENEPVNNPDKEISDKPIISEIPEEDKNSDISDTGITIDNTDTKTDEEPEKIIITPETGSDKLFIPIMLATVGAAAALSIIICRKRKSAVQ